MASQITSLPLETAIAGCNLPSQAAELPSDFAVNGRTPHPNLWDDCLSTLSGFRELQDDWDGLGAEVASAKVICGAIELAESLRRHGKPAPCRVIPGITGTVLFEWQSKGLLVEVEVTSESSAEVFFMPDGQPPRNEVWRW